MAWTTLEVEFFFSFLISISICERGQDQYLRCILRSLSRNRMKDSIKHDGQNFSMNEREAREEEREDWKFCFLWARALEELRAKRRVQRGAFA